MVLWYGNKREIIKFLLRFGKEFDFALLSEANYSWPCVYRMPHHSLFVNVTIVFKLSFQGERRIRVHTMCYPIVKTEMEVYNNVDSKAIVTLLSKMGKFQDYSKQKRGS